MAVGATQIYDAGHSLLLADTGVPWDAAAAGSYMFCLAKASYTPADTHTTVADLGVSDTDYIATGDGAPINATTRAINQSVATTYLDSDAADFGAAVTVTAKYLVCVQPVVAGTFASTSKLVFYIDLNSGGGSLSSVSDAFKISPHANGWLSFNQA